MSIFSLNRANVAQNDQINLVEKSLTGNPNIRGHIWYSLKGIVHQKMKILS